MMFPKYLSFTVTNACNLRCRMCGQWGDEGYLATGARPTASEMTIDDWKRLVDEAARHNVDAILLRGGEPFVLHGIMELVRHITSCGIFVSIDTNGTLLERYAEELVGLGPMHITFSVDGPEAVHDHVRGVPGSFQKTKAAIARVKALEAERGAAIGKSICFTISGHNFRHLGTMPDVARELGIATMNIVPYYYVPNHVGATYAKALAEALDTEAFSWTGFHRETSGVDPDEFKTQLRKYRATLGEIHDFPFMPFSEADYLTWFAGATEPVGQVPCNNVERLLDIQPNGDANFCVDFPDYIVGNVRRATIAEVWNSDRAERFRKYRRETPLAVCHRCGAKYMSELEGKS